MNSQDCGLDNDGQLARQEAGEFIVRGPRGYVAEIDPVDGDTEWAGSPFAARIFRGAEWREVWTQPGLTLLAVPEDE